MNTVIRHIEYLVSRKDCVIVPELGAILAKSESATIDVENDILTPPKRIFSFNGDLNHNDGQLISSVARAEGISYDNATRKVKNAVDAIKSQLSFNRHVSLGLVGDLEINEDETITFIPLTIDSLSVDTFWLPTLQLESLSDTDTTHIIEAPIQKSHRWTFGRAARWAASIAILLGIGFVVSTPVAVDEALLASLAPQVKPVEIQEILPLQETNILNVSLPKSPDATITVTSPAKNTYNPIKSKTATYYIIVASLANNEEAQRFVNMHPNAGLQILDGKGFYRIYAEKAESPENAIKAWKETCKQHPSAWIYKQ